MIKRELKDCPNIGKVMVQRHQEAINSGVSVDISDDLELKIAKFLEVLPTEKFVYVMIFGYLSRNTGFEDKLKELDKTVNDILRKGN